MLRSAPIRYFIYNLAGALLPVLLSLATVPLYLHAIGAARYGIVSIAWILLGYFGFLDFGLSRASANALGRLSDAPASERAPVLMTCLHLNLGLGLVGGLALYFGGSALLRGAFAIPDGLRQETLGAFGWMAPMLPLGMVMGVATGALESRDRFLLANALETVGSVLGQIVPLICVTVWGPSLSVVMPALLLVRLFTVLLVFAVVFRLEWPVWPIRFHGGWARKLFSYGVWVSVSSVISPILDSFDQVLIGRLLGPVAVTHYAVPMNLALRSQIIAGALARTLFPRLSRATEVEGRRMTAHATVALIYGFGAACGAALILVGPFLSVWIGPDFAASARPAAEILMLGAWTNGVAFLPYNQLQAQARPDLTAKLHAAEILPFLAGLWFLIEAAGLPGAALAWTLRVTVDCVGLIALSRCLQGVWLRALPAVLLMFCCYVLAQMIAFGLIDALLFGSVVGMVFLIVGVMLEPVLQDSARQIASRIWSGGRPVKIGREE
jgi:O-antigen/teichoic acid export membrane protein